MDNKSGGNGRPIMEGDLLINRQPMSPTGSKRNAKQPKMRGGFVLDSDESEAEEDDFIPAVPPPPSQQRNSVGRNTESSNTSMPTKQVNKSRLAMLLGRNKDVNFPLKQGTQSGRSKSATATPPISPYNQGQAPGPSRNKLATADFHITKAESGSVQEAATKRRAPNGTQSQTRSGMPPIRQGHPLQGNDKVLQNTTAVSKSKATSISSSDPAKPLQVHSRPPQVLPSTTSIPFSTQSQKEKTHNSPNFVQRQAKRIDPAGSPQGYLPPNSDEASRNGTKQSPIARYFTEKLSTLSSPKTQKDVPAAQFPRKTPCGSVAAEIQPLPTHITKHPTQSPTTQRPSAFETSTRTTVARSQAPRVNLIDPRDQIKNLKLAPRAELPKKSTAEAVASMLGVAHDMQPAQKRKAEDITSQPREDTTPFKKRIKGPQSSMPVPSESTQQDIVKASVNAHHPPAVAAAFDSSSAPKGPVVGLPDTKSQKKMHIASKQVPSATASQHLTPVVVHHPNPRPETGSPLSRSKATSPDKVAPLTSTMRTGISNTDSTLSMTVSTSGPLDVPNRATARPTNNPEGSTTHTLTANHRSSLPQIAALNSRLEAQENLGPLECPHVTTSSATAEVPAQIPATSPHSPTNNILSGQAISAAAEPYFEYSIFQKTWTSEQQEQDVPATELILRPYTNINEANAQAEKLFHYIKDQYSQHSQLQLNETSTKRSEHSCSTLLATFSNVAYPAKTSHIKIYVQRDFVSIFANQTPQAWMRNNNPVLSKTAHTLRLFKLLPSPSDDTASDTDQAPSLIRVYHPLPCTEVYTTLSSANSAARNLQIELSHKKEPKKMIDVKWQEQNLKELNEKVKALRAGVGGEEGYWKSEFNACEMGGGRWEVVVEMVGICGPRN
ncbi:Nn.00g042160.m01.CDS01 [Neocucurbitaria sp. VM-36]